MVQLLAPASTFRDFGLRLVSAAVMLPAAFAAIWFGGEAFNGAVLFVTAVVAWEVSAMLVRDAAGPLRWGFVGAMVLPGLSVTAGLGYPVALALIAAAGVGLFLATRPALRQSALLVAILAVYIAGACVSAIWLRQLPNGLWYVLLLLIVVVSTDVGAYLTGRSLGGPKLAPAISPSKTWSGSAGGLVFSMVCVGLFTEQLGGLSLPFVALAALLSVFAQAGDLFESWLKRRAGVKDSGNSIPGHGGFFDRLDGYLAALPCFVTVYILLPLGAVAG